MHVLQRKAKSSKANGNGLPHQAAYDFVSGMWHGENGPIAYDPANNQTTKKNDLETGEDQKGE